MFLISIDASNRAKREKLLFELLDNVVMEVGGGVRIFFKSYLILHITYFPTGRMIAEKHPTIFWMSSVAHCLDFMLEDIGNIE
jgi:hypothetical protein